MRISELIEELQLCMEEEGDIIVAMEAMCTTICINSVFNARCDDDSVICLISTEEEEELEDEEE